MTADNQQFFTRCPHCRTMFRAASVGDDASQGWVKCGRCKKVFDSEKNKLDPSAFITAAVTADQQEIETQLTEAPIKQDLQSQPRKDKDKNITASVKQSSPTGAQSKQSVEQTPSRNTESAEEFQLSFVERKLDKKTDTKQSQVPVSKIKTKEAKADEIVEKQVSKLGQSKPASITLKKPQNKAKEFSLAEKITPPPEKIAKPFQTKDPLTGGERPVPTLTSIKKTSITPQQTVNIKAEKQRREEKSQWTRSILAQAQSWKKEKNRFQSKRSYTSSLFVIGLLALLIWQVVIVNYTKLVNYNFLTVPLNLTCAVFSCNQQQSASEHEFEILHASLRRHATTPGVITISASLINYSNSEKLLPFIRLDLTDVNESVVASKIINLVDNPQYIDPTISQLAPGQDVKLKFNIDRPIRTAVGFEISIIN